MYCIFAKYKHSGLATFINVSGSICFLFGLAFMFSGVGFLMSMILIPLGIGMFFGSQIINQIVVLWKLKKSLNDEKMFDYVQRSELAAYAFFLNFPSEEILKIIAMRNLSAAKKILDYVSSSITEDDLILALREADIQSGAIDIWGDNKEAIYRNKIFTLNPVVSKDEAISNMIKKTSKKEATMKKLFFIFLAVAAVGAVILNVAQFTKQNREITPYSISKVKDYTAVDVISLEKFDTIDDEIYYYFKTIDGESGALRLSESEIQDVRVQTLFDAMKESAYHGAKHSLRIYGTIVSAKVNAYDYSISGLKIPRVLNVISGSLEQEEAKERKIGTLEMAVIIITALSAFAVLCIGVNWLEVKKKTKNMSTLA